MKPIVLYMSLYASHHQKTITKVTHFIGIPAIMLALQILFSWLRVPMMNSESVSLAWVILCLMLAYYCYLDLTLSMAAAVFLVPLTYAGQLLGQGHANTDSILLLSTLFIAGWILQFLGHYFEGKKPAFLESVSQVFVAPAFLIAELLFLFGIKKGLQEEIQSSIK